MAIGKAKEKINPKKINLRIGSNTVIKNGEISRSYSEVKTKKYMILFYHQLDVSLRFSPKFWNKGLETLSEEAFHSGCHWTAKQKPIESLIDKDSGVPSFE